MEFPGGIVGDHALFEQETVEVLDAGELPCHCGAGTSELPHIIANVVCLHCSGRH
jgi:hypothetical protein